MHLTPAHKGENHQKITLNGIFEGIPTSVLTLCPSNGNAWVLLDKFKHRSSSTDLYCYTMHY